MSASEPLPCVAFVSCSPKLDCTKLLTLVIDDKDSTPGDEYVWKIDTKYYEAEVKLLMDNSGRLESLEKWNTMNSLGGVILYYDGHFSSSLEPLNAAASSLNSDSIVKLLVCDSCDGTDERAAAEDWCVNEGFEHLELTGSEGDEDRLKQALEAHVWPNLVQKSAGASKKKQKVEKNSQRDSTEESDDLDDFSTLFAQLATMKEQASCLAPEERKAFAEQVVLAYWRSIGGSDDELLDI